MEEREKPSYHHLPKRTSLIPNGTHHHHQTTSSSQNINPIPHQPSPQSPSIEPLFGAGTYIVQVPKDQVFRIPSPESSRRVNRNPPQRDNWSRNRRCCCFSIGACLCMLVVMIVVIAGIAGAVVFLTHDDPGFHVEHVIVFKNPPRPDQFDIRVKVENPNKYNEISYDQTDSKVTLSFKQKEIAEGKFPIFDQDPHNTTILNVVLVLHGSHLPEEIVKRTNSSSKTRNSPLSLSMDIGSQFKVAGLNINSKRIKVSCSLVVDRLDKNTQVLAQDCST